MLVCVTVLPFSVRATSARQAHTARRSTVQENLQTESHDKRTLNVSVILDCESMESIKPGTFKD